MRGMSSFRLRNVLQAVTLFAVWCALVTVSVRHVFEWSVALNLLMLLGIMTLPPTALGALFGRLWFGLLCGFTSWLAFTTWQTLSVLALPN